MEVPMIRERRKRLTPTLSAQEAKVWRGRASDALELTLLLADRKPEIRARGGSLASRFSQEVPHVDLRESLAVLALPTAISSNRLAAAALAELLSRRHSCERVAEALVRCSGAA